MLYTVYQITNLVNGKIYIGMHQTEYPNDYYLGSGLIIRRAIKKHGRTNFKKEVLHIFGTPEEMKAKEKELVTLEFVAREDTYNVTLGGHGGWFRANQTTTSETRSRAAQAGHAKQRAMIADSQEFRELKQAQGRRVLEVLRSEGRVTFDRFKGKRHTQETIDRIRKTRQLQSQGPNNSQYGTLWVCKEGCKPRKIRDTDLASFIGDGWGRGRKVR